jgi:hypothetical protein
MLVSPVADNPALLRSGMRDTSCMKAHVVKWGVFSSLFFLLATLLRGRGGHGCLDDWGSCFLLLLFQRFCLSSWSSSSCCFVMSHVFAVDSGMSFC